MSGPLILIGALLAFFLWKHYGQNAKKLFAGGASGAASGGGTSATAPAQGPVEEKWFVKHRLSILLGIAGVIVFFWGLYTPGLKANGVGDWVWNNWFPILVFSGIILVLIRLNAKALGELAGTLRTGVTIALLLLFFGFPAWTWITGSSDKGGPAAKPTLSMSPKSESARIFTKPGHFIDYTGSGFTIHCVYRDGRKEGVIDGKVNTCTDGPMLYQYLRNTTEKPNTVTYEYKRRKK